MENNGITTFIQSVKEISHIGICFYDLKDFFAYNRFGIRENRGHYCEFCTHARLLTNGRALCNKSDRERAVIQAQHCREPFMFKCHMGLEELIVPLHSNDKLLGIIFIGQSRIKGVDNAELIGQNALELGGKSEQFIALYRALPEVSLDVLANIGKMFSLYFSALMNNGEKDGLKDILAAGTDKTISERISEYIQFNYRFPISSSSVCRHLHMNQSYVARVFKAETGCTITQSIHHTRIENGCKLLRSSTIPIADIAYNIGYSDANYFSRLFKKYIGVTPEQYRAEQ